MTYKLWSTATAWYPVSLTFEVTKDYGISTPEVGEQLVLFDLFVFCGGVFSFWRQVYHIGWSFRVRGRECVVNVVAVLRGFFLLAGEVAGVNLTVSYGAKSCN